MEFMKIIKNETLIKRNAKIGSWTSLAALAVLGGGMYLSFTRPELFAYSLIALLLGFTLTQIGMYMAISSGVPRARTKNWMQVSKVCKTNL